MEDVTTVFLVVDRSETEDERGGTIVMFTSLPEAMGYMMEKDPCELYVVSEVVRLL